MDLARIRSDVRAGLPAETERLKDAKINEDFDRLRFEAYPVRHPDERRQRPPERHSPFLNRVLSCLTMHLYAEPPTRKVQGSDAATDWLKSIYDQEGVNTKMHQADRMALREDACAIRVLGRRALDGAGEPTGALDAERPIQIDLWAGHEFAVWCPRDRPTEPFACCTIDRFDETTRYRLYTPWAIETYQTRRATGLTAGGIVADFVGEEINPYGRLPFVFLPWAPQVSQFWECGPGTFTRKANDAINHRLTRTGDTIEEIANPKGVAVGVEPGWIPPSNWSPGRFVSVPGLALDVASPVGEGRLEYLHPPLEGPPVAWEDLDNYIRHVLHYSGIPESVVEAVVSEAASGAAIVRDQAPLIAWAKQRLPLFTKAEQELAALVLWVGVVHGVQGPDIRRPVSIDWPALDLAPPPEERDRADQFELDQKITSLVQVVMRRFNLDRDAALKHLIEVSKDRDAMMALGLIQPPPDPGAFGDPEGSGDQGGGVDG